MMLSEMGTHYVTTTLILQVFGFDFPIKPIRSMSTAYIIRMYPTMNISTIAYIDLLYSQKYGNRY